MNIQSSKMNQNIYQMAPSSRFQSQNQGNQPPPPPKGGEMSISTEGKDMQMMLRQAGDAPTALKESLSELDISSQDTSSMSDEDMEAVLTEFESIMGDYMHDGYTPASEMSSEELVNTITSLQNINSKLSAPSEYGMKPMGGPKAGRGPQGAGGMKSMTETGDTTMDTLESLLEALETEETDIQVFNYRSMEEMISLLNV